MRELKKYTVTIELAEVMAESKEEAMALAMADIAEWKGDEDGIIISVKGVE